MAKELMEIGGFITEGAEIVNHDNSLSGNGTVDSPLGVVPGYNETVLWEGEKNWWADTSAITVSENPSNFETIKVVAKDDWDLQLREFYFPGSNTAFDISLIGKEGDNLNIKSSKYGINSNQISLLSQAMCSIALNKTITTTNWSTSYIRFNKIIGINRKAQ